MMRVGHCSIAGVVQVRATSGHRIRRVSRSTAKAMCGLLLAATPRRQLAADVGRHRQRRHHPRAEPQVRRAALVEVLPPRLVGLLRPLQHPQVAELRLLQPVLLMRT